MEKQILQVAEFHDTYGVPRAKSPMFPKGERVNLRIDLLVEEVGEVSAAAENGDIAELADGIIDCMYILIGTAHEYGFAHLLPQMFDEVHRSNMSKLGEDGKPIKRADGKVLKGPNFTLPDLKKIILENKIV